VPGCAHFDFLGSGLLVFVLLSCKAKTAYKDWGRTKAPTSAMPSGCTCHLPAVLGPQVKPAHLAVGVVLGCYSTTYMHAVLGLQTVSSRHAGLH
jgi:hypothetical protein